MRLQLRQPAARCRIQLETADQRTFELKYFSSPVSRRVVSSLDVTTWLTCCFSRFSYKGLVLFWPGIETAAIHDDDNDDNNNEPFMLACR